MKMFFHNIDHCLKMMSFVGIHPVAKRGFLQYVILVTCISIVGCLVLLYPYFREEKINLLNITPTVTSVCLLLHTISKLSNLFFKRREVQHILSEMELHFWKIEDIDELEDRQYFVTFTNSLKRTYHIYSFMCINTATFFYCARILIDGNPVGGNLPFESYMPFDIPFGVLFIFELVVGYAVVLPIVAMDIFVLTIVSLTALQCKQLNIEFQNIFRHDDEVSIRNRFKKCNDHHSFLLRFKDDLNHIFADGFLAYMLVIVPTLCIEMYIVSTEKSLKECVRALIYSATLFFEFFICYCLPAQNLNDEADLLPNSVYFNNWQLHSGHYEDSLMLLGKSQLDMKMSAGGFTNVDLKTGFAALKSMVSYFMFLRTMEGSQ